MRLKGQSCVAHKAAFGTAEEDAGSVANGRTPGAKEGAEKVPREIKNVPQRLKPRCKQSAFGTAEAVPLSKTDFFSTSFSPRAANLPYMGLRPMLVYGAPLALRTLVGTRQL